MNTFNTITIKKTGNKRIVDEPKGIYQFSETDKDEDRNDDR